MILSLLCCVEITKEALSTSRLSNMIVLAACEMETLFGVEFKPLDSIIYLKGNVKLPYTYKFIIRKL